MATTLGRTGAPVTAPQQDTSLQQRLGRIAAWVALILVAIVALFPLYWLFVSALTPTAETRGRAGSGPCRGVSRSGCRR